MKLLRLTIFAGFVCLIAGSVFAQTPGTPSYPTSQDGPVSLLQQTNNAATTITIPVLAADTTINVASTAGFPSTGAVTLAPAQGGISEVILYTGTTGTSFFGVTRGADGTSAANHSVYDLVVERQIALDHNVLAATLEAIEAKLGTGASAPTLNAIPVGTGTGSSAWETLTAGSGISISFSGGLVTITNAAAGGGTQSANTFLGGPASGGPGATSFRAIVAADLGTTMIPQFSQVGIGAAPVGLLDITGTQTANGGTARAIRLTPILNAAANNDTLTGLFENVTFNNGSFTGVINYLARLQAASVNQFTVDAAGNVVAGSFTGSGSGLTGIPESGITNLTSDLAGKQASGSYITALTGDGTATGPGSVALTLKNTGTAGTYRSITFDAQGRETGGTNPSTYAGYGLSDSSANFLTTIIDKTGSGLVVGNNGATFIAPILGVASGTSFAITGTAGAGFTEFPTQSGVPTAPASGYREYADSTGRRSWIRASDGFTRTWDATLTANRIYTLQDASGSIVMGPSSGPVLFTGPTASRSFALPDAAATILTSNTPVTIGQGGTGTASTLTGLVRGNSSAMTAAELSGDATTSGSNAVTVGKVNGVSYGTAPSTNTVPVVTGSNTVTYETVPNAALTNSSITIQGGAISLGGSALATSSSPQFAALGLGVAAPSNGIEAVEAVAPSGSSGNDYLYPDSTAHRWKVNSNNGGAFSLAVVIANGTATLGTGSISSGACASTVTVSATGVATTDIIGWGFNGDPTGTVGYQASATGMLTIIAYPTANNINVDVCNNTAGSITPGSVVLNWSVVR